MGVVGVQCGDRIGSMFRHAVGVHVAGSSRNDCCSDGDDSNVTCHEYSIPANRDKFGADRDDHNFATACDVHDDRLRGTG